MDVRTMVMLSSLLKFDRIVDELQKTIDAYRKDPSELNKKAVSLWATVVIANIASKGTKEGADEVLKELDDTFSPSQIFKIGKN